MILIEVGTSLCAQILALAVFCRSEAFVRPVLTAEAPRHTPPHTHNEPPMSWDLVDHFELDAQNMR